MTKLKEATKPKKTININLIKIKAAKSVAFVSLFFGAAYGYRQMLQSVDENFAVIIVSVFILSLIFIISLEEK